MLTLGAVNAFATDADELFNHGKNFYFADFAAEPRRYIPWDLDSVVRNTDLSIYGQRKGKDGPLEQHAYQQILLNHPVFRQQYNQIMLSLVDGALSTDALVAFLNDVEPVLTAALAADPNSKVGGDVAGHFDGLRQWAQQRNDNVRQQVLGDTGGRPAAVQALAAPVPEPNSVSLLIFGALS